MTLSSNTYAKLKIGKGLFKMMRKTKKRTIAIATAMVTLLSASAVFAATTRNGSGQAPKFLQSQSGGVRATGDYNKRPKDGLKTSLDSLVTAGTITQVQEDAITAAISSAEKGPDGVKTALDALVSAGTITQAQEDVITDGMGERHNDGLKTSLDSLVTAGTIIQVQEDAITAAISSAEKGPDGVKAALDALVTAGTITQAQEDAITAGMGEMPNDGFQTRHNR